ncbi:MAG TPA: alginate lyase family protein [Pyrinomonadaceae bacterium]|nr:alginate lyase family protein [Pyrinomonadaceae bacterium]
MGNKFILRSLSSWVLLISLGCVCEAQAPRVFSLNATTLQLSKQKLTDPKNPDPSFKQALAKLERDAQKALTTEVPPVTAKTALPPSGDKHDYMSQAPYFWKNPNTKDGLPYIRKDGERNPEIKNFPDHGSMDLLGATIDRLATAYYFTGKEEYAVRATELLRMWFLDPKTLMHPNLEYAQAVPGVNEGRGTGILESRALTRVVDGIGLLNGSRSWTKADQAGLEAWFTKYYDWITTSKHGKDEAAAKNNHGTWYDVQTTSFALFIGKTEDARKILETAKQKRIAAQIEPDGKLPLELARTNSWGYSTMDLDGLTQLADLGDRVGVDLWNFQTADGRSIRKAIEFLYPFAKESKKWPYQQIDEFLPEKLYLVMRRAAIKYRDDKFNAMMASVPAVEIDDKRQILGN